MASEHEHWREQSDIYALGALDGRDLDEFEVHLSSDCALCLSHLRETREVLNLLHRSLRPTNPPVSVKHRILQQIAGDKVVQIVTAQPRAARRWRRISSAIAAGIIGVVISATYFHYRYTPRLQLYTSVIDLLRDPSTRDHALYGAEPYPAAKGRFIWNESGEGHVFATNLPPAPHGKMYAVWTIAQNSAPRYVGTINTDAAGQGGLHVTSAPSDKPVETFAVTVEPIGTTAAPTGPMVLVSKPS